MNVVKPAGEAAGNPSEKEEGESAPNHPSSKEIVGVTDSLEKLNNELQMYIGKNHLEDQLDELKIEDVKEQKIDSKEPSNVITMERMYESSHI